jgi:hypothetical protein
MRRSLRYLRIAFSATCGIACVLLIALWVRSYWWLDNVNFSMTGTNAMQSFEGVLSVHYRPTFTEPGVTSLAYAEFASAMKPPLSDKMPKWYYGSGGSGTAIRCPHWFVTLLPCVLAVVPWIPKRFTLRTLLIATTLVAAVLGLIVYAVR